VTIPNESRTRVELERLLTEIEGSLLSFASAGARDEWMRFRQVCAAATVARPRVSSGEESLGILVDKARRFREVLLLA
jgi:hypothetical protein